MKKNVLTKQILKDQSHVKVILNGGEMELDDATIPFQIAFDQNVANRKPTHILVLDITSSCFDSKMDRYDSDDKSERTLFKLEPIHYLQLKKPGIHNLIFILLQNVDKDDRRRLLERGRYGYGYDLWFSTIEECGVRGIQVGYVEAIVDVPKEFFAEKPENGLKKLIWKWTNAWYDYDPIDECDYRKRKIWAFTLKPILWLLGFIPRIIISLLVPIGQLLVRLICFFFGFQPMSFFPNKKELWIDFLLLYPYRGHDYGYIFNSNTWFGDKNKKLSLYNYKTLTVGKKSFYSPVAIWELVFLFYTCKLYVACLIHYYTRQPSTFWGSGGYLLACVAISFVLMVFFENVIPSIKNDKSWRLKWEWEEKDKNTELAKKAKKRNNRASWLIFGIPSLIAVLFFLATQIPWISIENNINSISNDTLRNIGIVVATVFILVVLRKTIWKFFMKVKSAVEGIKFPERKIKPNEHIPAVKVVKEDKYVTWLTESFNLEKLPRKVDINKMPDPSNTVHKFVVRFWWMKAKVCRPFAK